MHDDDTTEKRSEPPLTLVRPDRPAAVVVLVQPADAPADGVWVDVDEARLALDEQPDAALVVVLTAEGRANDVLRRIEESRRIDTDLVAVATPVTDAIKRVHDGLVVATVERVSLRSLCAPAVAPREFVQSALAAAVAATAIEPGAAVRTAVDLVAVATSIAPLGPPVVAPGPRPTAVASIGLGPDDLVIFDNDGVLVDSEPIALAVLVEMLAARGWHVSVAEATARFMGGALSRATAAATAQGATIEPDFAHRFNQKLFGRYHRELRTVDGVAMVLDALDDRGVPYCVASSGTRDRVELSLTITGLRPRFADRVVTADDVRRSKPDPAIFLLSARRQSVEASRCLVIEDSALGIEAARRAGMRAIGIATLTAPERLADASEGVVRSMAELQACLR